MPCKDVDLQTANERNCERVVELTAPDYMILIVEDLDRALHFYTGVLGLRLGHCFGDYAQLDTGATSLALYTRSAMAETLGLSLEALALIARVVEYDLYVAVV